MASDYFLLKKYNETIWCYERVVAINPTDVQAYFNMGILYHDFGNYNEAIRCYKEILNIDPNNAKVRDNMKKACDSLRNHKEE
jgi:tetratricopeptide (TPR) repeat protein